MITSDVCRTVRALAYVVVGVLSIALSVDVRGASAGDRCFALGVSAPLSGILAEYGAAVVNGIELAKRDHPDLVSKVCISTADSKWDAAAAVSNFNELRTIKKVNLIYNWGNPTSEAVAPIAQRLHFPVIAMSSDPAITRGGDFVIRSLRSGEELGALTATYLARQGYKKLGLVVAENSYVRGIVQGLRTRSQALGLEVDEIGSFDLSERDFRGAVTRIKTRQYDALGVLLVTGQVQTFFKQLRAQAVSLPTFGADFFGSQAEIAASGEGIEGAVFPDIKVSAQFRKRYVEAFGSDVQIAFAANAYDVVTMVAREFSQPESHSLSAEQIVQQLKTSRPLAESAHGSFAIDLSSSYGPAFVSEIIMRKVQGGAIVDLPLSEVAAFGLQQ
jgi:branched-chain amino acid transport system substrate-binding protein